MKRTFPFLILFGLINLHLNLQAQTELVEKLESYVYNFPQEKVYLHLDKPYYTIGQDIWFKAYLLHAYESAIPPLSKVVYVELMGSHQQILTTRKIQLKRQGGAGQFFLSDTLAAGDYTMRAYTQWNRNFDASFFFSKTFRVYEQNDDRSTESTAQKSSEIALSFFPEGGELIAGVPSMIGFKALDEQGHGVPISGDIIDTNGKVIGSLETFRNGMGKFILTPVLGQQYVAVISHKDALFRFPLPPVKPSGYAIKATHSYESEKVLIAVYAQEKSLEGGFLLGHQNGREFLKVFPGSRGLSANLYKEEFPEGICHLTFFDAQGIPQSERIITINIPATPDHLNIAPLPTYRTREKVTLDLSAAIPTNDTSAYQNLSVAITPREQAIRPAYEQNIKNFLHLSSDLKGNIEEPEFYFTGSKQAYELLEVLMLTQGWRRFTWEDVINEKELTLDYLPERSLSVEGRLISNAKRKKGIEGVVFLSVMNEEFTFAESITNKEGYFLFDGLAFEEATELLLEGKKMGDKKGKLNDNVVVELAPAVPSPTAAITSLPPVTQLSVEQVEASVEQQEKIAQIDEAFKLEEDVVLLDEIEVAATSTNRRAIQLEKQGIIYAAPSNRLVLDSINAASGFSVFDMVQSRIPGVSVYGVFPNQEVFIRTTYDLNGRARPPLFTLNGVPVDQQIIGSLAPTDIAFIDILKGPKANIYGPRAAFGVFAVYTKTGSESEVSRTYVEPKNILKVRYPGYSVAKEFYSPDYEVMDMGAAKPDFRSTLYWNPDLMIREKKASVTFHTSDQKGVFDIIIEGVTSGGQPVFQQAEMHVK